MFRIHSGSPGTVWASVDCNDNSTYVTLYNGQLVYSLSDGVANLGQASGASDTSGKKVPFGIVVGNNKRNPQYSTTSNSEYITSENCHTTTTEWAGGTGPYMAVGDKGAMVKVALINPTTIIEGQLFNSTLGTPLTVGTVTTGSTDGTGFTSTALNPATPVADLCTVYCRTGANAGIYRMTTDTSATVKTVSRYFPYDIAVGDTFVGAPIRMFGNSYVQTDSNALFFDASASPATNYWTIVVLWADLSVAGQEKVWFQFSGDHFNPKRT